MPEVHNEPTAPLLFLVPHLPAPLAEGQDGWAGNRTNERVRRAAITGAVPAVGMTGRILARRWQWALSGLG